MLGKALPYPVLLTVKYLSSCLLIVFVWFDSCACFFINQNKCKMKPFITILLALFSTNIYAQCEQAFFSFDEGATFEYTSYDKRGREDGKNITKILKVEGNEAFVHAELHDKDGKKIVDNEYTVLCEGDRIKIDFRQFAVGNLDHKAPEDAEVVAKGDFLELPNDLEAGQELPVAHITATTKINSGATSMTMDQKITIERTVEGKETRTTPAGTFETYRIAQKTTTTMQMMGMNRTVTGYSKTWVAKGVGMVKSETYQKNGRLLSYSLLTAFSK
jgi:hypothetical protein